ncbi:hypothetical protein ABEB36_010963 [Hypothenemus hampei]|uniref:COMM domain-containing protein 4 n=1 Tax=Hypothenemus hampei TaxID=57062 RepID=A0ABD1EE97_HYPHA
MRFRFNGGAGCPEWIIHEVTSLSYLSCVKLKTLSKIICEGIINPPIQYSSAEKLFQNSKLEDRGVDLKCCISCLTYIISAAIQFNCDSRSLHLELQQLGLPIEHTNAIKRVFDEYNTSLKETFKDQSLKINPLEENAKITQGDNGCALLQVKVNDKETCITMAPDTVDDLINELLQVKSIMTELKS